MPRRGVFFKGLTIDGYEGASYVDAKDFNRYVYNNYQVVDEFRMQMVRDDCYEILSMLDNSSLMATIEHYIDEFSINLN